MRFTTNCLIAAIFKFLNHYQAILPYNLNWQIKLSPHEKSFLDKFPLVVCDVGARGTPPEELAPFFSGMSYHAFDADEDECNRLKNLTHSYRELHVFPYFIGRKNHKTIFNLYKNVGESSSYMPGERFKQVFRGNDFDIVKKLELDSTSLDEVYIKEGIDLPDFLKLDTQGSELDILYGSDAVISNTCMLEIEVEFLEMYEGQPLFHDVLKYMYEKGFELLYLNRVTGLREQIYTGPARGQLIFGDALFGRREDCLDEFTTIQKIKYILLLINFGHIDFACHILKLNPEIDIEYPTLYNLILAKSKSTRLKRVFLSQLDKLALIYLHIRKYNQLSYDSDRSWPTR